MVVPASTGAGVSREAVGDRRLGSGTRRRGRRGREQAEVALGAAVEHTDQAVRVGREDPSDRSTWRRLDVAGKHRRVQRAIVLVALIVLPLAFLRLTLNPFSVPKALAGWLLAVAALAVAVTAAGATGRLTVGRWPVLGALAVLAAGALGASTPEGSILRAVAGDYSRHAGLLAYTCAGLLLATTAAAFRRDAGDSERVGDHPAAGLLRVLLGAIAPIAGYGALQAVGADPLDWVLPSGPPRVFSTLGNANFLAGWLAMAGTAALWGVLTRTWTLSWRVTSGVLAAVALLVALATSSAQGPAAGLVGAAVLVAVRLTDRAQPIRPTPRRVAQIGGGLALVLGLGIGVTGVTGVADDVSDSIAASYRDRTSLWAAATTMGAEAPWSGVGLDAYGDRYHRARPLARALRYDDVRPAGTQAHNVALQLFAGGGLPLLVGWLALVLSVAAVGLGGLGRLSGERRLLLGGVLATWCAYLTQSMVSIDAPALLGTGWILAGGVLAAAPAGRTATLRLPAAATVLSAVLAVAIVVAAGVPWLRFLRADLAAGTAVRSADAAVVEAAADRALALAGWEPAYPLAIGRHVLGLGEDRRAVALLDEAIRRNPELAVAHLDRARILRRLGRPEEAAAGFLRLVELVPTTPSVLEEAAAALVEAGEDRAAEELRRRAEALRSSARG